MSGHALLSASSSHRWLSCTPSARLEQDFENTSSVAAEEGTAAHALCEHKLRKALKMRSKKPVSHYDNDEMDTHTDGYVDFIMEAVEQIKQTCSDQIVLIEQRLDFSHYVPDGFGTGDCVIIGDSKLHIIDFKYGQGVLVEAESNPQMMLYALGALEQFGNLFDINEISMTIYQPRRENVSTWIIPVSQLREWVETVLILKAKLAFDGNGDYCPGDWCTFCRAKTKCRARAEEKLQLAQLEFARPPLLTDLEIEAVLTKLDDLTSWANDIKDYALQSALGGKQWNDFKLVEGRSNRKYVNEEAAANAAKSAGYHDIYKQSLITLTEMEKLMGKAKFQETLGAFIEKPPGKPTLVPLSDKRKPINISAKNDFNKIMEE